MKYDIRGREIPDDTPVEMPIGYKRPPSLVEVIQRLIKTEVSRQAVEDGEESFEEADDFDCGDDDPLPASMHELSDLEESASVQAYQPRKEQDNGKSVEQERTAGDRRSDDEVGRGEADQGAGSSGPAGKSAEDAGEPVEDAAISDRGKEKRAPRGSRRG